jgi:hypothetical protein
MIPVLLLEVELLHEAEEVKVVHEHHLEPRLNPAGSLTLGTIVFKEARYLIL